MKWFVLTAVLIGCAGYDPGGAQLDAGASDGGQLPDAFHPFDAIPPSGQDIPAGCGSIGGLCCHWYGYSTQFCRDGSKCTLTSDAGQFFVPYGDGGSLVDYAVCR